MKEDGIFRGEKVGKKEEEARTKEERVREGKGWNKKKIVVVFSCK